MLDGVTSLTCNVASMQTVLTTGRCLVLDAGVDLDSDALAGTSTATRQETGRHIIAHVSEERQPQHTAAHVGIDPGGHQGVCLVVSHWAMQRRGKALAAGRLFSRSRSTARKQTRRLRYPRPQKLDLQSRRKLGASGSTSASYVRNHTRSENLRP